MRGSGRSGGFLTPAGFEERLARSGEVPPVVVAAGPESFLRDQVVGAAVAVALGDPESPDAVVLHGPAKPGEPDATTLAAVLEDVRTPSMFAAAGTKVVVLRRADLLLGEEVDSLLEYLKRPCTGSMLALEVEAEPNDRNAGAKIRSALAALEGQGKAQVVACSPPSAEPGRMGDASPLGHWVAGSARARGKRLDPAVGDLLVHRSGTALATLDAAIAAAALHAGAADGITAEDVEAVAPRGPAEGTDRLAEAVLAKEAQEALRLLAGLYREGACPWGAKTPVRGDAPVTFLLLNQVRRLARDARAAIGGAPGEMPPSLRYGCRDPRTVVRRSTPQGLASLLAAATDLEAALKSGASGGERARFEALVLRYAEVR